MLSLLASETTVEFRIFSDMTVCAVPARILVFPLLMHGTFPLLDSILFFDAQILVLVGDVIVCSFLIACILHLLVALVFGSFRRKRSCCDDGCWGPR